jgi:hypothetical protein
VSPLAFLLPLLAVSASARTVAFRVHGFATVSDADYQEVALGIELFARVARRSCGADIVPVVSRQRHGEPGEWTYSDDFTDTPVAGGGRFRMRWYQASMYRVATVENLPLTAGQIDLFVRPRWENCGTSFPRVQLQDAEARAQATNGPLAASVLPWVMDRVMLVSRSGMGDCGDYTRVVAHELGHLFVQDDPPHRCPLPDGRDVPCDAGNLMAHSVEGGRDGELYERLAEGTSLSPEQCRRLDASLRTLWDPVAP